MDFEKDVVFNPAVFLCALRHEGALIMGSHLNFGEILKAVLQISLTIV